MPDGRDFGTIINERRLALGYSLGQLANRVEATAATLRSWERGEGIPDDATIGRLAGELDLSGGELRQAARRGTAPDPSSRREAPGGDATAMVMAPVFSDAGDTGSAPGDETGDPSEPGTGEDEDGEGDRPVAGTGDTGEGPGDGPDPRMVDLPTEAVAPVPPSHVPSPPPGRSAAPEPPSSPVVTAPPPPTRAPVTTRVTRRGDATPDGALLPGWQRGLRTLFDPEKRYLFWLRTALTVVVMLVFLRVLAWAVPAFFDVISDILDTIESTTDTTLPGGVPDAVTDTTLPAG